MKGLSLSGGSTKIAGIAGAAISICKEGYYKPDYITGISAGAILALPIALGLYNEIEQVVINLKPSDIFSIEPLNKRGFPTFKAITRLLRGKESLGKQDALINTIKKVITRERFEAYLRDRNSTDVYIGVVNMRTGTIYYDNVKSMTYNSYFDIINASSAIPVFVESVKKWGGYLMDGGLRDNIGSHWLMNNVPITHHISVYARPKGFELSNIPTWKPKGVLSMLNRSLEITNLEKSLNDEFKENVIAKAKGIKTKQVFLDIVEPINYNTDTETLHKWYDKAYVNARMVMNTPWTRSRDIDLEIEGVKLRCL